MGMLAVAVGPMFSGKSDWLIDRFEEAPTRPPALSFTPSIDTRGSADEIRSHSGRTMPAKSIATLADLGSFASRSVVIVDEVQFLTDPIVEALIGHSRVAPVFAAGLDYDFARRPFETTAMLVAAADEVIRMTAVCTRCGSAAAFTQRFVGGRPAPLDDARVLIGDEETYQPRCERCWLVERQMKTPGNRHG